MKTQYIATPAFQLKDEIIPIWDKRVTFVEDDYFGNSYNIDRERLQQITAVYDVQNHKLIGGIEVDIYPYKTEFVVDQQVYHEAKGQYRKLTESFITSITYESFDLEVKKGSEMERYTDKIENFDPKAIYVLKLWEPTFHCNDGFKTNLTHQLYAKT